VDHPGYWHAVRSLLVHCARLAAPRAPLVKTKCSSAAGNPRSARGRPPAPCFARVCWCVCVSCAIGRAVTSVASAHLEIRLEANPEGAAPGEAAASCSPEKAQTGEAKACRPTPGAGSPRHGWGLPPAPSHSASAWFQFLFCCCYVSTQLALQLHQERTQVVCSNKVAQKRPARRHSRNGS